MHAYKSPTGWDLLATRDLKVGTSLEWQEQARCKGRNSAVFYPQRGVPTASARALCKECPVKAECLSYALENDERFGIWGGLSERERRKLQRERRRIAVANSEEQHPLSA